MSLGSRKLRIAWGLVAIFLTVFTLQQALTPTPVSLLDWTLADKLLHVLAFGALMWWWGQLCSSTMRRWLVVIGLAALGVGIELAQTQSDTRMFEYTDMLADGVGVLLGAVLLKTRAGRLLLWMNEHGLEGKAQGK